MSKRERERAKKGWEEESWESKQRMVFLGFNNLFPAEGR